MSDERGPQRDEPVKLLRTFGKVLLSLVLGFAALIALGATVCGFLLVLGLGSQGWSIAAAGAAAFGLLLYAIGRIWR